MVYEQFHKSLDTQKSNVKGAEIGAVRGGEQGPTDVEGLIDIPIGDKVPKVDTGRRPEEGRTPAGRSVGVEPVTERVPRSDSEQRGDGTVLESDRLGEREKAEGIKSEDRRIDSLGDIGTTGTVGNEFQKERSLKLRGQRSL